LQETSAAIKVQAAFRRCQVQRQLERQGVSTLALRKSARRRRALERQQQRQIPLIGTSSSDGDQTDDRDASTTGKGFSSIFDCCGVGLSLGGSDDNDVPYNAKSYEKQRKLDQATFQAKVKAREDHERQLIAGYGKTHAARQLQNADNTGEAYEVVDPADEGEETSTILNRYSSI
jgi:hypothetical protein